MIMKEFYYTLTKSFQELLDKRSIHEKTISVKVEYADDSVKFTDSASASKDDAVKPVGDAVTSADSAAYGPEAKLVARYEGVIGECYTPYPGEFTGTLAQVAALDIENDPVSRSIYLAAMNAVMNKYELADDCRSCDEDEEVRCGEQIANQYKKNNGKVNVLLAGYQPHMMKSLAERFPLRVLDLDPENIGKTFFGVTVEDGKAAYAEATRWAEVVLCSGSSLANGTFFDYVKLPKDVMFYGTTIAGAARVLGLRRTCPFGKND